jgi:NAD+ diphosphatase
MKSPNFYAGLELDRAGERRRDAEWLQRCFARPDTRLLPVWRSKNLVVAGETPQAAFLVASACDTRGCATIFLGEIGGTAYFALDLSTFEEEALAPFIVDAAAFVDLRTVGALMDRQQGGLLAYARGLSHWHARHRFCGVCGSATESTAGGHVRLCTNAACATEHFPRTDPAVIMLVTDGERCLLGHHARWTIPMYSTLAGFVEPGESLEDAVAREVYEEVGVRLADIQYHSSQPWPFPASIMLGFAARAATTEIQFDRDELADARWFSREFLSTPQDPNLFRLPRVDSIARRLIDDWLAHG